MILVIAEKPSVAQSIAKVLKATDRKDGYIEGNGYIVSWCVGHLIGLANPEDYDSKYAEKTWKYDTLPIIPDKWLFSVNENTKKQFAVLRTLINKSEVTELVCATDAGREGELIFRFVYNQIGSRKPFQRLWVSSLEEKAIQDGFNSLKPSDYYDNLYQAGLCRAKADWLVGMNGTRLFSSNYHTLLSVGRVQTPTLAMIVEREEKIEKFIKEKSFAVDIDCTNFIATSEKISEQAAAEKLQQLCNGNIATIIEIQKEKKVINPPKLFDLTTLQREANRMFGYTAQQTLEYAQSLYEAKLITYPRTDSQFLTTDMADTAIKMVNVVGLKFSYFPITQNLNINQIINNNKVSDHHALLPTAEIEKKNLQELPIAEQNILLLICSKLLCATGQQHLYEATTVIVNCSDNTFTAKGKTILQNGWKVFDDKFKEQYKKLTEQQDNDDKALPVMFENQVFENVNASISEHWSNPPKHFTEDTLLSAMEVAGNKDYDDNLDIEKKGLGTPATRASIIENLIKKQFVVRSKKYLLATEKGVNLIAIVPDIVKSAKMTADWEMKLKKIEDGQASSNNFMNEIISFIQNLVSENPPAKEQNNMFHQQREPIGICPKCGGTVTENSKAFSCDNNCGFYIYKTIASKVISGDIAKQLLKGKTRVIKGFINKAKNKFNAALQLSADYKIEFIFENK